MMVLRSVYLSPEIDDELRTLAYEQRTSMNDLIRQYVEEALREEPPDSDLYFEAHVTVEPLFEERLEQFRELAQKHQFRVAELLMKKRPEDTPERSQHDSFCTGRSKNYRDLSNRMQDLVVALQQAGIQVWRYKVEETVLDSAISDELELLASN